MVAPEVTLRDELYFDAVTMTSTGHRCEHNNGYFHTIYFFIFYRKYFFCSDCGALLTIKEYVKLKEKK